MDRPDRFYSAEVEVTTCEPLNFEDLAPILNELNEHFVTVRARRDNLRPPMAGALDVAIGLLIIYLGIGGAEYVRKFAGMLAEDSYKGLRDGLRKLRDRADAVADERIWTLTIQVGSHPFHFQGPMTDEEFGDRLRAAQAILDTSSETMIVGRELPGEMEPGWYWRGERWEATPVLREWMDRGDPR